MAFIERSVPRLFIKRIIFEGLEPPFDDISRAELELAYIEKLELINELKITGLKLIFTYNDRDGVLRNNLKEDQVAIATFDVVNTEITLRFKLKYLKTKLTNHVELVFVEELSDGMLEYPAVCKVYNYAKINTIIDDIIGLEAFNAVRGSIINIESENEIYAMLSPSFSYAKMLNQIAMENAASIFFDMENNINYNDYKYLFDRQEIKNVFVYNRRNDRELPLRNINVSTEFEFKTKYKSRGVVGFEAATGIKNQPANNGYSKRVSIYQNLNNLNYNVVPFVSFETDGNVNYKVGDRIGFRFNNAEDNIGFNYLENDNIGYIIYKIKHTMYKNYFSSKILAAKQYKPEA